jgi:pyruvate carboxylase
MREGEEIAVDLESGKTLLIQFEGQTEAADDGEVKLFFELNGQTRAVRVAKAGAEKLRERPLAEADNPDHVGAPMPGMVVAVAVSAGQKVKKGDPLLSIEAMKMETQIRAEADATVKQVIARRGVSVEAHELLLVVECEAG